jgi:hypothetical protein
MLCIVSLLGSLLPCYPYWATKSISATKVLAISGPIGMLCYAETSAYLPVSSLFSQLTQQLVSIWNGFLL